MFAILGLRGLAKCSLGLRASGFMYGSAPGISDSYFAHEMLETRQLFLRLNPQGPAP